MASGISNAQGFVWSAAGSVTKVELFVDGKNEGRLPCCSERGDVQDSFPTAPLRTGFSAAISWGRFDAGMHTMRIKVTDSEGNTLTETRQVETLRALKEKGFSRDLSLDDADCLIDAGGGFTCAGVKFSNGTCKGSVSFRWQNAKQAFEVVDGCD